MIKTAMAIAAGSALALGPGLATAQQSLAQSGTITVGNIVFSNFSLSSPGTALSARDFAVEVMSNGVKLMPVADSRSQIGSAPVSLSYQVSLVNPGTTFTGVNLTVNGRDGSITQTIRNPGSPDAVAVTVNANGSTSTAVGGSTLLVSQTLAFTGGGDSIHWFSQTFDAGPVRASEPAVALVAGFGLVAGIVAARRARRRLRGA